VIGASAILAMAAACLLIAVRFWPIPEHQHTTTAVVLNPETTDSARQLTYRKPDNSGRILPRFEAQLDLDETEMPTFSWPIQEKSALMVSTALRPDLLD
jgi:hypothetical protein